MIMKATIFVNIILLVSVVSSEFDDCSRDYSDGGHFAISGVEEDIKAPWLAALGIGEDNYDFFFLCSGTIITKKFLLSAAHCFIHPDTRYKPTHVRAGANDIDSRFIEQKEILDVKKHPDYDDYIYYYDIAIIEIVGEFKFTSRIYPICLPDFSSRHPGNDIGITVQGWGVSDEGKGKGKEVSQVTVIVRSKLECDENIEKFGKSSSPRSGNVEKWMPQLSTDVLFCADASLNNKTGVCQGDSGGPAISRFEKSLLGYFVKLIQLFCRKYVDGRKIYFLIGIVTGNVNFCEGGLPDVYNFIGNEKVNAPFKFLFGGLT